MPHVHPQRRKWVFTINNPIDSDNPGTVLEPIRDSIKYAVHRLPPSAKPHIGHPRSDIADCGHVT
jgi:hypothetical protein